MMPMTEPSPKSVGMILFSPTKAITNRARPTMTTGSSMGFLTFHEYMRFFEIIICPQLQYSRGQKSCDDYIDSHNSKQLCPGQGGMWFAWMRRSVIFAAQA